MSSLFTELFLFGISHLFILDSLYFSHCVIVINRNYPFIENSCENNRAHCTNNYLVVAYVSHPDVVRERWLYPVEGCPIFASYVARAIIHFRCFALWKKMQIKDSRHCNVREILTRWLKPVDRLIKSIAVIKFGRTNLHATAATSTTSTPASSLISDDRELRVMLR